MKFSDKELNNYRAFERVRASGRFNMFDPRAAKAAGLDRAEMAFCMKHYEALRAAAEEVKA